MPHDLYRQTELYKNALTPLGRPVNASIRVNATHATCEVESQSQPVFNRPRMEYIFRVNREEIDTEIRSWEDTVPLPPCTDGNVTIEVTCWGKENDTNFESPPSDSMMHHCSGKVFYIRVKF